MTDREQGQNSVATGEDKKKGKIYYRLCTVLHTQRPLFVCDILLDTHFIKCALVIKTLLQLHVLVLILFPVHLQ